MPLSFEWDESKEKSNLAKHGVSFEEASTVFGDLANGFGDGKKAGEMKALMKLENLLKSERIVTVWRPKGYWQVKYHEGGAMRLAPADC